MSGLSDKVVVITGGSSGIGAATALEFAKHGAKLVLTGRNQSALQDVAKQCLECGSPQVHQVLAELTNEDNVKSIARETLEVFGTIHVLVNNAGGGRASDNMTLQAGHGNTVPMDYQYNLCVRSPWQLSGLFVDELIKNKGCIVNVSSVLSHIVMPIYPAYGTMKAAMDYMTRCMATELGMQGVRVNAVLPGSTLTSSSGPQKMSPEERDKARAAFAAKVHLLEQKVLVPADVAKSIVFLASDAASRITGVLLPVDGGFMLSSPAYDFAGTQAIPGLEQEK